MIHDAKIDVSCDNCDQFITLEPEFVCRDYSGKNGHYDCSERAIERMLENKGWIVEEDKHYCTDECSEEKNDGNN